MAFTHSCAHLVYCRTARSTRFEANNELLRDQLVLLWQQKITGGIHCGARR